MTEIATSDEQVRELAVADAVLLAIKIHGSGDLDTAETLYNRILEASGEQADALHFLGLLNYQRGRNDIAIELIRRSIEIEPRLPDSHNNLGNVLAREGREEEAAEAYLSALKLDPDDANAHANLGVVLRAQGKLEESERAYRRAIELDSEHLGAYQNLGNLLRSLGRVDEAVICLCHAMTLQPGDPKTRKMLGVAYTVIGKMDEAAQVYREWLADTPDDPVARHLYAACTGEGVPERAGDEYIQQTFNSFADTFDSKLETLNYRAPDLIARALGEALAQSGDPPGTELCCLDAGCGTGLCGALIAPRIHRLIGVDLSANMLERARRHNVYDELVRAELTEYLESHQGAFDLVVSADTLVYFGALERVMQAATHALRPDGLLIFTLEDACDDRAQADYHIQPHGRYAHDRDYVARVVADAALELLAIEPEILRKEAGKPVAGLLVSALKRRG